MTKAKTSKIKSNIKKSAAADIENERGQPILKKTDGPLEFPVCQCGKVLDKWNMCGEEEELCVACSKARRGETLDREAYLSAESLLKYGSLTQDLNLLLEMKNDLDLFVNARSLSLDTDTVEDSYILIADRLDMLIEHVKVQRDLIFKLKVDPEDKTDITTLKINVCDVYDDEEGGCGTFRCD